MPARGPPGVPRPVRELTARKAGPPPRTVRAIAPPAIAWSLALAIGLGGWSGAAAAATGPGATGPGTTGTGSPTTIGASSEASLQTQAQELAGQIDADGRTLDELDGSYQAAEINYTNLKAKQAQLRRSMAATTAAVAAARQALKQQAILAYLAGGAPIINYLPDRPGLDPSLTLAYAEIVAGGQKAAAQAYRSTLDAETKQKSALDANAGQVAATLASIKSDEAQAQTTLASQRQALSQVKGQLAVAVAAVQAEQQAAQQAQEKAALVARGQLPAQTEAAATQAGGPTASAAPTSAATRPGPTLTGTRPGAPRTSPTTAAPTPTTTPATAATTTPPTTAPPAGTQTDSSGDPTQAPGVNSALAYAQAQLGKPYQWGGAGPNSFDCSGLVMMAWAQAGIDFPHLAQDQYDMTARISLAQLIPGDLVFFGTPDNVYHVGIYVGNGNMIDAPETGQNVQVQSIYWDTLLGAGRVTTSS